MTQALPSIIVEAERDNLRKHCPETTYKFICFPDIDSRQIINEMIYEPLQSWIQVREDDSPTRQTPKTGTIRRRLGYITVTRIRTNLVLTNWRV